MSECLTSQQLALVSFSLPQMRKSWTSFLTEHPYRPHISPHDHSFVYGLFFTEVSVIFSIERESLSLFWLMRSLYFFHLYVCPALRLWAYSKRRVLLSSLLPAFNQPSCEETNTKRLRSTSPVFSPLDFYHRHWIGGPRCIQSLTPMKWTTPWPIEEQDTGNGGVQSCSEAPIIQPSVLIKTLCAWSIPVDNRLHLWGTGGC